jgi:hypothetical protein
LVSGVLLPLPPPAVLLAPPPVPAPPLLALLPPPKPIPMATMFAVATAAALAAFAGRSLPA